MELRSFLTSSDNNDCLDGKILKELNKIRIKGENYFENEVYDIYKLNKLSKQIIEYYLLFQTKSNNVKNVKNDKIKR